MRPSSKNLNERITHLPANDKSPEEINSIFIDMVKPIRDVERSIFFHNVYNGIKSLGYISEVFRTGGEESFLRIPAADNYFIEIRPQRNKAGVQQPLMLWYEYEGKLREFAEKHAFGITGTYMYQADFTLILDENDPIREAELDLPASEDRGTVDFGTISHSSYNFQEFIQGAIYKMVREYDVDIYPKLRAKRRRVR
jgi:hypothetical protein